MRNPSHIQLIVAVAATAMFAGCSGHGSSALGPGPVSPASTRHLASFYSCPASGSIKYVADDRLNAIYIYSGRLSGQSPCGQIASAALNIPTGLHVQAATHDLYVANKYGHDVLVFHRGDVTPYNTYTDPTGQLPIDITVAPDGTVLASNYTNPSQSEAGSISTWIGGPSGGTFVGNFPETNSEQGAYIAVKKNGTVYFDDVDRHILQGFVWTVSCPAGACGVQTRVRGVVLQFPGGIAFDSAGDLLVTDVFAATADTFELPNPVPSTFSMAGRPWDMIISTGGRNIFTFNSFLNEAVEYSYPGGALIGSVSGVSGGAISGVAVDP
jgi:hypothetical protein